MNQPNLVAVVDIETLGQRHNAVIGAIGVVMVDVTQLRIVDEFYCRVNLEQNRIRDTDTQAWWDKQKVESPAAWEEMFGNGGRLFLTDALHALSGFLGNHFTHAAAVELMGNGCEFDNLLLADAYQQWGIEQPWWFRGNQSLRTVVWMGRQLLSIDPKYQLPFEGARHHALHDARHEAAYLIHILRAFQQGMAGGALADHVIQSGTSG